MTENVFFLPVEIYKDKDMKKSNFVWEKEEKKKTFSSPVTENDGDR